MKPRLYFAASLLFVAAAASFWVQAQGQDTRPLAALFPPGALFYLEAKDFNAILHQWNASTEKKSWLQGDNYQVLSRSRLIERLGQARDQFATVAGIPVEMNLVNQAAGTRSALAFYDLSRLRFVYITELSSSSIESTQLWQSRTNFKSHSVAGISYYSKTDPDAERSIAFASYRNWLVLATDEARMVKSLTLLSAGAGESLNAQDWFTQSLKHARGPAGDLRLVYNLTDLLASPAFRTYWLQRNATELKPFASGVSDLLQHQNDFEEHRVMLRKSAESPPSEDHGVAEILHFAPPDAALYRAWNDPDTNKLKDVLTEVTLSESPSTALFNAPAPTVTSEAGAVGSETDLEVRIDEPALQSKQKQTGAPVTDALLRMQPTALLHVQKTELLGDQVFISPNSGMVILCKTPDEAALQTALSSSLSQLQSATLDPLRVRVEGNAVILSRLNLSRVPNAVQNDQRASYVAVYNHAAGWPHYKKLFSVLDRGPATPEGVASQREPSFFQGNVQSIGDSLAKLQRASIVRTDEAADVTETVRYELAGP